VQAMTSLRQVVLILHLQLHRHPYQSLQQNLKEAIQLLGVTILVLQDLTVQVLSQCLDLILEAQVLEVALMLLALEDRQLAEKMVKAVEIMLHELYKSWICIGGQPLAGRKALHHQQAQLRHQAPWAALRVLSPQVIIYCQYMLHQL